ncbi:MAG TPA: hypothetical protein VHW47_03240, partial [Acidimicrobiales bacterium]|nr:hypothetical protein [Acidimicrobiales bacterium]
MLSPVRLPRAEGLTEALLAPAGPGLAGDVRRELAERLDGELRRLVRGPGRVTVTPFLLRRAGWAPGSTPFRWSA